MTRTLRRFAAVVLFLLILLLLARRTDVFAPLGNLFKPKHIKVDETPLRVAAIKNIAQLMTIEAYSEVVVDSARYPFGMPPAVFKNVPANPFALFGSSQLVLIVRGKVVAGVDLQGWDSTSVRIQGDSLFVQLPHAEVLDVITNPSGVETFIEEGAWDAGASAALQAEARNRMVQEAIAQGALQQADARARQLVHELFKNAGYNHVEVTTAMPLQPSRKQ